MNEKAGEIIRRCSLIKDRIRSGVTPTHMLNKFNPLPDVKMQKKFRYFYTGYSPAANYQKHMLFSDEDKIKRD